MTRNNNVERNVAMTEKYSDDEKIKFAAEWAKNPVDPFKAALTIYGDAGRALVASRELENDPSVITIVKEEAERRKRLLVKEAYNQALISSISMMKTLRDGDPEKTKIVLAILTDEVLKASQ